MDKQLGRLLRSSAVVLTAILGIAALLRFYRLSAESFWFDEAYSVWVARHSVGWHLSVSVQRIFPPLYYLLLHFWLPVGETEFAVRTLSVLIGLGCISAAYALAREFFDARVGLLSALLLAISPLHIWYSQEARMYILVATLGLCSAYSLILALRHGRLWQWLAYVLSTAMAMSTHYFAIFLVPFQNAYVLYLLLRRRTRPGVWWRWVCSQVSVALLSLVGLAGIVSAESDYWWGLLDTWHGAPTLRDLVGLMFAFSLGTTAEGRLFYWLGLVLFALCAVSSGVVLLNKRPSLSLDEGVVFTLLYFVVPVGVVFALSQFRSFWVLRYLFLFLPPYCILVGRGISRMPGTTAKASAIVAVMLLSVWPIANIYRYEQKEDWRAAVRYVATQEQPTDALFLLDEDIWLPFEHYYEGSMRRFGFSRAEHDRDLLAARVGAVLPGYRRVWLVLSHTENLALKEYLEASPHTELLSEEHFTGIEVDLFAVRTAAGMGS